MPAREITLFTALTRIRSQFLRDTMIDKQSSASEQDYASDRSAIGAGFQGYGGMNDWIKYYANQCMKLEVITLRVFALWPRKVGQRRSRSLIYELIQGHSGMHGWVKLCVNRCRKSEVIMLIRFVLLPRKVGQGHPSTNSFNMFKAMVGCITGSNCV